MKRKISLFIDTFHPGGAERICINYANELTLLGHNVTIVAYNDNKQFYVDMLHKSVKVEYLGVDTGTKALFILLSKPWILNSHDNIIAFNHQISLILLLVKLIFNKNYNLISRNVNNLSKDLAKSRSSKSVLTKFLMSHLYSNIGNYIAQCESMKEAMIEDYSIDRKNIIVIKNPISKEFSNLNVDKTYDLLFVGRLKKQKGIDKLVQVIEGCKERKPDLRVKIVGQGELESYLLDKLNYFKVNYDFERSSSDLLSIYNRSEITILTSYYEGYPNVLVESLACGTPVISFDCESGPSEIIDNGVNGFIVPCFDTVLFVDRINEILNKEHVLIAQRIDVSDFSLLDNILK